MEGEAFDLAMPSWTPGSYLIRDYAGHVERLFARTPADTDLAVEKVAKNLWRIETEGAREAVVEYDVWAGSLSVQDNWVEQDFALLNSAGVFMYSGTSRALPQYLEVDRPPDWAHVNVALPGPDEAGRYLARNFDELVDSPLLLGNTSINRFEVGGAKFALVTYGDTGQWVAENAVQDLGRLSMTQLEFWGVNPFEREYLFLNVLLGGRGGLEHDHSTVMMAAPSVMRNREEYVKWLALASHELFHAWNVRRMRPQALSEYNYDQEVYTRQLWLAEGLTSYYDNLLLFRAGVVTVQEYFDLLAAEMQQYEIQPGRLVTTAEQASFDSWIRLYKPTPNTVNSNSNYYRMGSLIGFVVDAAIRGETRGRKSLDDALVEMYARFGPDGEGAGSYRPGALRQVIVSLDAPEAAGLLATLLATASEPDVDGALDWYGLELVRAPDRQTAEESGAPVPVDFGLTWRQDTPQLLVENVLHGGAAARAGVLPNDELLAINGMRVTRDNHDAVLKTLLPGEEVTLTLVRHQRLLTLDVAVQHAIPTKYLITTKPRVSRREERHLERWLGRPLQIER